MKINMSEKNENNFRDLVLQLQKTEQNEKSTEQQQLAAVLQDFNIGR